MNSELKAGQKLWFINKKTNKKELAIVSKVYDSYFTFYHRTRLVVCPKSKLGKGIFFFPENKTLKEKSQSKNIPKIFYMGEMFVFDEKWQRYDGKIYSEKCQKRLTELYKIRKKYYKESAFDLVNKAHEAIKRKDLSVAVSYFEIATVVSFRHEIREFMAELSSLYRNFGKPNASIELYKYIKYKHSDFSFPSDFLTSLAAAYLDIGKKEEALRLADRIYGRQKGLPDEKLKKLYNRTDSY